MLTTDDAWQNHLTVLREIMELPPTPRVPGECQREVMLQRMADALHLQFPRRSPLPEDKVFIIIEKGLNAASAETLAELLINPVALELLRTMVEHENSEVWAKNSEGRELTE